MPIPGCMGMPFAIIMPGCIPIGAGTMPVHAHQSLRHKLLGSRPLISECKCPHLPACILCPQVLASSWVLCCLFSGQSRDHDRATGAGVCTAMRGTDRGCHLDW